MQFILPVFLRRQSAWISHQLEVWIECFYLFFEKKQFITSWKWLNWHFMHYYFMSMSTFLHRFEILAKEFCSNLLFFKQKISIAVWHYDQNHWEISFESDYWSYHWLCHAFFLKKDIIYLISQIITVETFSYFYFDMNN